jgi:hypothetical protein
VSCGWQRINPDPERERGRSVQQAGARIRKRTENEMGSWSSGVAEVSDGEEVQSDARETKMMARMKESTDV